VRPLLLLLLPVMKMVTRIRQGRAAMAVWWLGADAAAALGTLGISSRAAAAAGAKVGWAVLVAYLAAAELCATAAAAAVLWVGMVVAWLVLACWAAVLLSSSSSSTDCRRRLLLALVHPLLHMLCWTWLDVLMKSCSRRQQLEQQQQLDRQQQRQQQQRRQELVGQAHS
jgi:hypothetical protein